MNIIITGAGRGIGYETVKYFAKHGKHTIIAVSRNIQNLKKLLTENDDFKVSRIIPVSFDLNSLIKEDGIFLGKISEIVNSVDVLINNAGYLHNETFEKISKKEAIEIFNTNFFATSFLIKELLPFLGKNKKSHVVNIGSMGGVQGSSKYNGLAFYSSAKAALSVLTECLATEFDSKRICFNCLALGAVDTEMLKEAFPGYKAPVSASEMAAFIADFSINGHNFFNGKIIPVALSNP